MISETSLLDILNDRAFFSLTVLTVETGLSIISVSSIRVLVNYNYI